MAFQRYLTTNSTNSSALARTPGLVSTMPSNIINVTNGLVLRLMFFGTTTDNQTFSYRIFSVERFLSTDGQTIDQAQWLVGIIGSGTGILSGAAVNTGKGVAGSSTALATTELLADTLTFTASGVATSPPGPQALFETGLNEGTTQVYLPTTADLGPAILLLPCLSRWQGIGIEFSNNAQTAVSMNALYSIDEI